LSRTTPLTRDALAPWLGETLFARVLRRELPAQPRIGVEVELLALAQDTSRVASVHDTLLPLLRAHGFTRRWQEQASPKGAPRFRLPSGGIVTMEPGGQIEYATPPHFTPAVLIEDLDATIQPLVDAAAREGIDLVGAGIDPFNALEDSPLQIRSERYTRLDAYFSRIGPAGPRMMRQTASVQVNVDPAFDGSLTWRVWNAAAPLLTAIFANSRIYAGSDSGYGSFRAETWRRLDPQRTGILPCRGDLVGEYAELALAAPMVMMPSAEGETLPLRHWLERGPVDDAIVADHLTTLFPEVRPKGYLEIRPIDALPPWWYAAPVLLIAGITFDSQALAEASELLGLPRSEWLEPAGSEGLRDQQLRTTAQSLARVALAACERMSSDVCTVEALDRAWSFFDEYTFRGRAPEDQLGDALWAVSAVR
jgi:glutamate--cysteine ligase